MWRINVSDYEASFTRKQENVNRSTVELGRWGLEGGRGGAFVSMFVLQNRIKTEKKTQ
jgi:hypothetical protein